MDKEFDKFLEFKAIGGGLGLEKKESKHVSVSNSNEPSLVKFNFPKATYKSQNTVKPIRENKFPKPISWGYSDQSATTGKAEPSLSRGMLETAKTLGLESVNGLENKHASRGNRINNNFADENDFPHINQNKSLNSNKKVIAQSMKQGGLLNRTAAMLVDMIVIASIYSIWVYVGFGANKFSLNLISLYSTDVLFSLGLLFLATYFIYFVLLEGLTSQSIGKKLFGLRLENISPLRLMLRTSASIFSLIPAGLGLFWCVLDEKKRAWHDVVSGIEVKKS